MNVEIGAEAALFPEKEYISGIFVAVFYILYALREIWNRKDFFKHLQTRGRDAKSVDWWASM